jgi:hypothetical protein
MSGWTADELARIGGADEFRISSGRADGSQRPYITIWAVREGDDLYVRSAHGYDNPWFQRALHSGHGRIQAGGIERDVVFEVPEADAVPRITAAYHAKYDRYGPKIVGTVVSAEAERATVRLEAP